MSFEETTVRHMCDTLKYRSESVESGWERKRNIFPEQSFFILHISFDVCAAGKSCTL